MGRSGLRGSEWVKWFKGKTSFPCIIVFSDPLQPTPTHSNPLRPSPTHSDPLRPTPTHSNPLRSTPQVSCVGRSGLEWVKWFKGKTSFPCIIDILQKEAASCFFYCFEFLFKPLHPRYPLQPLYTHSTQ